MTYNVFSGTLNPAQSQSQSRNASIAARCKKMEKKTSEYLGRSLSDFDEI